MPIPVVSPPGNESHIDITQEALNKNVTDVLSVVYSNGDSVGHGCYLKVLLPNDGQRTYFYSVGDVLPSAPKMPVFRVSEIDEVVRDRKYRVIFEDMEGNKAFKEYPPT